jgi:hypothetical protein
MCEVFVEPATRFTNERHVLFDQIGYPWIVPFSQPVRDDHVTVDATTR